MNTLTEELLKGIYPIKHTQHGEKHYTIEFSNNIRLSFHERETPKGRCTFLEVEFQVEEQTIARLQTCRTSIVSGFRVYSYPTDPLPEPFFSIVWSKAKSWVKSLKLPPKDNLLRVVVQWDNLGYVDDLRRNAIQIIPEPVTFEYVCTLEA